jgi:hypothetical protein
MGMLGRRGARGGPEPTGGGRITIVGGRPPAEEAARALPRGIDQVLARAALDHRFRERLNTDRVGALDSSGVSLSPAERGILLATSAEQLEAMVEGVARNLVDRRGWFARVAGVFGVFIGGALLGAGESGCCFVSTKGERIDVPPSRAPSQGIRPGTDPGPTTGIRPDGTGPDPEGETRKAPPKPK